MKTNAIARIIIYSMVILVLLGLLLAGLGAGMFIFEIGGDRGTVVTAGGSSVDAAGISNLEIEWASGSVTIQTGDTDQIFFSESGNFDDSQAMVFESKGGKLFLSYAKPGIRIGFVSLPSKDLVITVPEDWVCQSLELDGAALEININGLTVGDLSLDGASCRVFIDGAVSSLDCDGAACEITMNCTDRPREIDLDGADCSLSLTLPKDCGFLVQMDGLSCDFDSSLNYTGSNGDYIYGDRYCKINVDGLSCEVMIDECA